MPRHNVLSFNKISKDSMSFIADGTCHCRYLPFFKLPGYKWTCLRRGNRRARTHLARWMTDRPTDPRSTMALPPSRKNHKLPPAVQRLQKQLQPLTTKHATHHGIQQKQQHSLCDTILLDWRKRHRRERTHPQEGVFSRRGD